MLEGIIEYNYRELNLSNEGFCFYWRIFNDSNSKYELIYIYK